MMTEGRTTDVPVPVASVAARQGLGNLTLGVQIGDGLVIFGKPWSQWQGPVPWLDGLDAAEYERIIKEARP